MFKRLINILLTILLVNCNYNIPKGDLPLAKEGIIDLRNIDFSNSPDQVVDLDGSWVFIWNEFVNPNETEILSKYSHYINVPSQWQKEKDSEGKTYPAQGYASYYLKVLLPENYPELSISMSDTGMAYSLYLNGELQSSNGKVGKSKEEMEIRQKYAIFPIRDRTLRELNIIIHNSNFHYHKAGLWQRIRLGKTHVIEESHYHNIYIDLIVASCLFIMGLYHLGLFVNRRKDKSPLYFGFFCILVGFRTITIKERLIYEISDDLPFFIIHKIEFFSFYYGSFLFLKFMSSIFPDEIYKPLEKVYSIIFNACSLIVILLPISIYVHTLQFIQLIILSGIIYSLRVFFLAIKNKRVGAKSFLFGLVIFFLAIIHDIFRSRGLIYTPFMASYGLLFFLVSQAIVLSRRFANAFVLSENLSRELKVLSENLEIKVQQRTHALNNALNSIQKDLSYAKRIQNKSLNIDDSVFKELNIVPYYSAMVEVGGDFYGISEPAKGRYRIFLADVTGHGIQAALITMAVKGIYDNIKDFEISPSRAIQIFNNEFVEKYQSLNSLLTCIFLDIIPGENKLIYASAGHPPGVLQRGEEIEFLEKTGRMVGIMRGNVYSQLEKEFLPGDRLFLYSDGIYEEFNNEEELFGEERFFSLVKKHRKKNLEDTINHIIKELNTFLGKKEIQDDITILGIELKRPN